MSHYSTDGPVNAVFAALQTSRPEIQIERLTVTHPADSDDLWFISVPDRPEDVQLECYPHGQPPFLVEGDGTHQVLTTSDANEAAETVLAWLASGT
ncbi:hypothetical protein BU204_03400 [Actinophytocola xanthii]|uniref:Uncharacterized protein n=2 Tax=Actinophytocola xanthii TaxID=1912961 RepID=A0A1Q8CX41_9PSEU|nr:hypothetical protein BU204_03400 [Actinophytocola xanthii]